MNSNNVQLLDLYSVCYKVESENLQEILEIRDRAKSNKTHNKSVDTDRKIGWSVKSQIPSDLV